MSSSSRLQAQPPAHEHLAPRESLPDVAPLGASGSAAAVPPDGTLAVEGVSNLFNGFEGNFTVQGQATGEFLPE